MQKLSRHVFSHCSLFSLPTAFLRHKGALTFERTAHEHFSRQKE